MEKNYSVGYDVAEDLTHGIKAHSVIVADFVYPQDAEDFILIFCLKWRQIRPFGL